MNSGFVWRSVFDWVVEVVDLNAFFLMQIQDKIIYKVR